MIQSPKVKVLYIAGYSFSGSTILSNILGEIDHFFNSGELRCLWEESLLRNYPCGCGVAFQECQLWRDIFEQAFPGQTVDAAAMVGWRESRADLPLMLSPWGQQWLKSRRQDYLTNLAKLYRAIQTTTGCRVIVDSSKSPLYGYMLDLVPEIELSVVQLVRNPKAVQHSCWKRKHFQHRNDKWKGHSPLRGSLTWNVCNLTTEAFWGHAPHRYLKLTYEEFVQQPRTALTQILNLVQEPELSLPLAGDRTVQLGLNHTAIGNDNRFRTGPIELRLDEKWKGEMKPLDQAVVSALAWPLRRRYGYLERA